MKTFSEYVSEAKLPIGAWVRSHDTEGDLAGKEFQIVKVNGDEVVVRFRDDSTAVTKIENLNIDPRTVRAR